VIPDQVYVDPVNGVDPVHYQLESVKKNGPFAPILKGNVNFICVKSGLFDNDPDSDAGCAGEPAILIDPNGEPVPGNIDTSGPQPGVALVFRPAEPSRCASAWSSVTSAARCWKLCRVRSTLQYPS
jgi:hypothetical protein